MNLGSTALAARGTGSAHNRVVPQRGETGAPDHNEFFGRIQAQRGIRRELISLFPAEMTPLRPWDW